MAKNSSAKRSGSGKAAAPLAVPDALGDESRIALLTQQLAGLQQQRFALDMLRHTNDHKPADEIPRGQHDAGEPETYKARTERLLEAERRLAEAFPDLMPTVRERLAEAA